MDAKKVLPAGGSTNETQEGRTNQPHRILLVDDDSDMRVLNADVLCQSGYKVDAAADGAAAWQALTADFYDLLITDNRMPKMTGVDLLKKLRAAHLDMPVIMATGVLPTEEFARYPWLQPAATLVKPYTSTQLLLTVKEVLRAADSSNEPIIPPSNWESRSSIDWWQL